MVKSREKRFEWKSHWSSPIIIKFIQMRTSSVIGFVFLSIENVRNTKLTKKYIKINFRVDREFLVWYKKRIYTTQEIWKLTSVETCFFRLWFFSSKYISLLRFPQMDLFFFRMKMNIEWVSFSVRNVLLSVAFSVTDKKVSNDTF